MPKIKLKKQENYEFMYDRTLQVRDINYGGHLGNDSLVSIMHEARIDLLNKLGFNELNLGDDKTGIIMADLAVNYLGQGFMLDKIKVYSHIDEITGASFRIFHNAVKENKIIALAETGIIAYDYNENVITNVPDVFLNKLNEYKKSQNKLRAPLKTRT